MCIYGALLKFIKFGSLQFVVVPAKRKFVLVTTIKYKLKMQKSVLALHVFLALNVSTV